MPTFDALDKTYQCAFHTRELSTNEPRTLTVPSYIHNYIHLRMLYTFTLNIYKHAILKSRFNLNQHLVPKIDTTLTIYLEVLAQFIGSVQLLLLA